MTGMINNTAIDDQKRPKPADILTGDWTYLPVAGTSNYQGHKPLDDIQRTALALDSMGILTMPMPHISEWRAMHTTKKSPYLFREFRNTRLHRCGPVCERLGRVCHPRFETLFVNCNLAVWAGRMSRNMVCLDCDSVAEFQGIGNWLMEHGIPQRGWMSRRGGTFVLRCKEGEVDNISEKQGGLRGFPNVECHGSACYHVIPPSANPANLQRPYVWLPGSDPLTWNPLMGDWLPEVSNEQLRELGVRLLREKKQEKRNHPQSIRTDIGWAWGHFISEPNRILIMSGFDQDKRSHGLFKVALDLAAAITHYEVDEGEAFKALQECAGRCRPPYEVDRLMEIWRRAQNQDPEPAREYYTSKSKITSSAGPVRKIVKWVTAWSWKGQAGQTDRAVALACCERMRMEGKVFRATTREIAELANVTRHTAEASLRRLSGRDTKGKVKSPVILEFVSEDKTTASKGSQGSSRWKFLEILPSRPENTEQSEGGCRFGPPFTSGGQNNGPNLQPPAPLDLMPRGDAEQDAAKTLGGVAWGTWNLLQSMGSAPSVSALARKLGKDKGTVSRAVSRLIDNGLATRTSDGSILYTARALEVIAAKTDKAGRMKAGQAAARRERHQYERGMFLNIRLFYTRIHWSHRTRSTREAMGLGGWLYENEIGGDEKAWLDLQRGNRRIRKEREAAKADPEKGTRQNDGSEAGERGLGLA